MTQVVARKLDTAAPRVLTREEPAVVAVIREILFPSDLSPASDLAFEHARLLAERFRARLTLYHAVETGREGAGDEPDAPERERLRRAVENAHQHLDRRVEGLSFDHRVVVEPRPHAGSSLLDLIAMLRPDLLVMATHGREGLAHLVLGSVTERILQHAQRPVLCVREPDHGLPLPYRRILLPTDLSKPSRRAFPMAATLARAFGAEVLAVHVVPLTQAPLSGVTDLVEAAVPDEEDVLRFLQPELRDVRATVRIEAGSPWERIAETARLEKADVIVMSTHGHDSLADRLGGSHTERVVRHAPCPVLVT